MKKFIAFLLTVVLTATVAVSGTLAFFSDTEDKVNVMTAGTVDVELVELQRTDDKTGLEEFQQGKDAMPYVDHSEKDKTFNLPTADTHIDKIVYATNTGNSDAYIRILVAIPVWANTVGQETDPNTNNLHWNYPGDTTSGKIQSWLTDNNGVTFDTDAKTLANSGTPVKVAENVEIDGEKFDVHAFTIKNPVSAGESTNIVMTGLYLDTRVGYDADSKQYLDVNGVAIPDFDGTINVPVLVQAVQTTGFSDVDTAMTKAFGEANAENAAKWFADVTIPTVVTSYEELMEALTNGVTNIIMGGDINADGPIVIS